MGKKKRSEDDFSESIAKEINKDLEDDVVSVIEDGSPSDVEKFVSTGSTLLDFILSNQENGGAPVGKIIEISGLEGTGKTLVAMQICANAQKAGGLAVYLDPEHAFNTDFAQRIGLDIKNNFIYGQPASVEDVFKTMFSVFHKLDALEKSNKQAPYPFVVIIWDSVAATPCAKDIADENPDPTATVGLKPRILSKNISTLLKMTGRGKVAQVFLNQLRMKIGAQPFEDPYITPGGKAIPYASSARIRLKQKGKIKIQDEVVGIQCVAEVVKTRFGPPYRKCEFGIYFDKGVDDAESMIDMLVDKEAIHSKNSGSKGKLMWLPSENEDQAVNRLEFKKRLKKDEAFRKQVLEIVSKTMVKRLNPDEQEITLEKAEE